MNGIDFIPSMSEHDFIPCLSEHDFIPDIPVYYRDDNVVIYNMDNRDFVGKADVVITDPPYSLSFMGKKWDNRIPDYWDFDAGWLFAFGGTRTWHRLACAIEDSGWTIKDTVMYLHGQGFPKGKNSLKPAFEPIIVARKYGNLDIDAARIPSGPDYKDGGVRYGASAMPQMGRHQTRPWVEARIEAGLPVKETHAHEQGRWPANLVLECTCEETIEGTCKDGKAVRHNSGGNTFGTDRAKPPMGDMQYNGKYVIHTDPNCPCRLLDEQSGKLHSNSGNLGKYAGEITNCYGQYAVKSDKGITDSGGASRFFKVIDEPRFMYCSKASKKDRGEGNTHSTVKPTKLMEWLIKLSGGQTILDPFMGSGTTLVAAKSLGRKAIGVEISEAYCEIAANRCRNIKCQGEYSNE